MKTEIIIGSLFGAWVGGLVLPLAGFGVMNWQWWALMVPSAIFYGITSKI